MIDFWKKAYLCAKRSQDTNTQVGAVLDQWSIYHFGWNYEISEIPGKLGFIHAEMDAIASNRGGVLYCTWGCCTNCAKLIVTSEVSKLVTAEYDYPKWNQEIKWGHKILVDNGVAIEFREPYGKLLIGGKLR